MSEAIRILQEDNQRAMKMLRDFVTVIQYDHERIGPSREGILRGMADKASKFLARG